MAGVVWQPLEPEVTEMTNMEDIKNSVESLSSRITAVEENSKHQDEMQEIPQKQQSGA